MLCQPNSLFYPDSQICADCVNCLDRPRSVVLPDVKGVSRQILVDSSVKPDK